MKQKLYCLVSMFIFLFSSCKKQDANFCWLKYKNSSVAFKQVIYDNQLNDYIEFHTKNGDSVNCYKTTNKEAKKYVKDNVIEKK